jgi:hypothetical protein
MRARHIVADVGHARFIFFLLGGVSSVTFFTIARERKLFFPNTGDVRRRFCRRPSLSVVQLGMTGVLVILWVMLLHAQFC